MRGGGGERERGERARKKKARENQYSEQTALIQCAADTVTPVLRPASLVVRVIRDFAIDVCLSSPFFPSFWIPTKST